jgi:hypothetical protein
MDAGRQKTKNPYLYSESVSQSVAALLVQYRMMRQVLPNDRVSEVHYRYESQGL